MLTAFVAGTRITNFGADEFAGGDISMVVSQTDAPATNSRGRGMLWFARGEGRLYKWEVLPAPLTPFYDQTYTSPQVGGLWLSLSDRRDIVIRRRTAGVAGDIYALSTAPSEYKAIPAVDGRHTLNLEATSVSLGYNIDPIVVCPEGGSGEDYSAGVDFGFTRARVRGGTAGQPVFLGMGGLRHVAFATNMSAATVNNMMIGFLSQSDTTDGHRRVTIFLKPSSSNIVHA